MSSRQKKKSGGRHSISPKLKESQERNRLIAAAKQSGLIPLGNGDRADRSLLIKLKHKPLDEVRDILNMWEKQMSKKQIRIIDSPPSKEPTEGKSEVASPMSDVRKEQYAS